MHIYLDKSVNLHLSAFGKSLNLYLTDCTHVQVVHGRTPTKTETEREKKQIIILII